VHGNVALCVMMSPLYDTTEVVLYKTFLGCVTKNSTSRIISSSRVCVAICYTNIVNSHATPVLCSTHWTAIACSQT